MNYYVSALNQVKKSHDVFAYFTSKKKASEFAQKLAETGAKEIKVVNETRYEILDAYNF